MAHSTHHQDPWLTALQDIYQDYLAQQETPPHVLFLHSPVSQLNESLWHAPNMAHHVLFAEDSDAAEQRGLPQHIAIKALKEEEGKPEDNARAKPNASRYDMVLIRAVQNKIEQLGLIAQAASLCTSDGHLMIAQSNDQGAKTLEKSLRSAFTSVDSIVKHKCRAFRVDLKEGHNPDLLKKWTIESAPKIVESTGYTSQAGIFGWNKIDAGSRLLMAEIQNRIADNTFSLTGHIADFGCGYGYLSVQILGLQNISALQSLTLIDHDLRAIEAASKNIAALQTSNIAAPPLWGDLSKAFKCPHMLDAVIMNPPFHDGKKGVPALGHSFIQNAHDALKKRGKLVMVANRHLPYEAVLSALFSDVQAWNDKGGFKIIYAQK